MRILVRILVLLKKYWKWLVLTYICLIALTAATMIVPLFIGDAITNKVISN
jgi:ABC-type multidrug transport system fused ATPase/permease subunit